MARLRSCKYCGRIHATDFDCGKKPKRVKESTEVTKLRDSFSWKKTRRSAYERDHYLCRVCLAQGVISLDGLEAHHIIPLVENASLAFDLDNVITLCSGHHKEADAGKLSRERLRQLITAPL